MTAAPRAVVITIDGFSVDVLNDSPTLCDLAAVSRSLWPHGRAISPTLTYANHASLYSGAEPEVHGVPMNDAYVPGGGGGRVVNTSAGYLRAPTLMSAATSAGLHAEAVLGDQHVARLLLTTDPTARVWPRDGTHAPGVETDGMGDTFDRWVVEECLRVLAADDPDLLLVHLNDTDTAGHVVTPHGDLAREWRARTDRELARLIDALRSTPRWASTTVVIVSDHDMLAVDTDEPILLQQALDAAGFATTVVPEGGVAGVWLRRPEQADDIADVVRAMPGVAGAVLPNALAAVASGHVVAHADARHAFAADEHEFRNPGVHGQPAAARTLAVIAGGDERLRTTPAAEQLAEAAWPRVVDWAPTVAYLLGIPPPAAASGRVLHEAVAT